MKAEDRAHECKMGEGLREIADLPLCERVVFLAQQPEIVAKPEKPVNERVGLSQPPLELIGVGKPEAAGEECPLARR